MLSGKQRRYLKSMANRMTPTFQIGKNGVTDNFLNQVDEYLEVKEIIKIKILNNSFLDTKETANEIANKLNAEFVQSIGNKFVIYRESEDNKTIKIPR